MPSIIRAINDVMADERRDMHFLQFTQRPRTTDARTRHLRRLAARDIHHVLVASNGWLEGDPGLYAVYFKGRDDP